jgi:hypothetical protein
MTARSRLTGVLAAILFASYLVELAPHLVHHVFDEDDVAPTCPFVAPASDSPIAAAPSSALAPCDAWTAAAPPGALPLRAGPATPAARSRAPPAPASLALATS